MEENSIMAQLEQIFREVFSNESLNITRLTTAKDIEEWNSLNHMIIISEVENTFLIKFKLKDLNKIHNVGDMIDFIVSKL